MPHIKKLMKIRGVYLSFREGGFSFLRAPLFYLLFAGLLLLHHTADSGPYLDSAHANGTYGAKRTATGFPADYTRGLCAHCHETHAAIDGSEPEPAGGGPSKYQLFYDNHISQTDNFCFECHRETNSWQDTGTLLNYSYSYRAGGWTDDPVNDILEAFSFVSPDSSHSLDDISSWINGNFGYTADSNPCAACHNPHAAQRAWPLSLPSAHSTDNNSWTLFGDDPGPLGERMDNYSVYQAPYRFNSSTTYEPDGSGTQDGSNLTDFVDFCTDCHNNAKHGLNLITSTALGRLLYNINWSTAKHGEGLSSDACADILPPYQQSQCSSGNYVLSCTDCHEPHGSPNIFLIRKEVNNAVVTVDTGIGQGPDGRDNKEWVYLCESCHDGLNYDFYHTHPSFVPPDVSGCSADACHLGGAGTEYRPCGECHFHGNDTIDGTNYGEELF